MNQHPISKLPLHASEQMNDKFKVPMQGGSLELGFDPEIRRSQSTANRTPTPQRGRSGLMVGPGLGAGGSQAQNPIPLKIRRTCRPDVR
ncbi:hypothetical protein AVEN_39180-1 [Araneus ventricosus]|uniref:Uncharacterized protein n=1 Tax=Araneus ventricosus TaxID=182803 RepID=A0A4Y2QQX9_ARAVE|nr:hypothetical protein AVEN_232584-1 [Araneus ventricosus]GBN65629.1 hypothetical protein AVEN_236062-1 [Araneus ventricosus]GBN65636.1 hypothetical protein AVEN_265580-1 [Araneus ventricosus]GBN65656.1 hypothetical protein AVEN_39180-1 [Araneus ventricosus]